MNKDLPHTTADPPVIGVSACRRLAEPDTDDGRIGGYHTVGEKYLTAVTDAAAGVPVLLPALGDGSSGGRLNLHSLLAPLDGLLMTGSPSNIEPHHYDGDPSHPNTAHDPERDATTLPLIRLAVEAGLPLLAICRGLQELNVAFGGTLHQSVQELPRWNDHPMPQSDNPDARYGLVHGVRLIEDGTLAKLAHQVGADPDNLMVNSLHAQAIDRLADRLTVEAISNDGIIEGVRVIDTPTFALGVQWHPEYRPLDNPFSTALFRAFGDACRVRRSYVSSYRRAFLED